MSSHGNKQVALTLEVKATTESAANDNTGQTERGQNNKDTPNCCVVQINVRARKNAEYHPQANPFLPSSTKPTRCSNGRTNRLLRETF